MLHHEVRHVKNTQPPWVTVWLRFLLISFLITAANEVCEDYVFTGVCLSTGGGSFCPLHAGIHPPRTRGRHPQADSPLGRCPQQTPPGETPPRADTTLHSACWDMVNKWMVRIPLECILVFIHLFPFYLLRNHINIVINQWQIQIFPDGRCAIPRGGESMNPLFGKRFAENCMNMKEIGPLWIRQSYYYEMRTVFVTSN